MKPIHYPTILRNIVYAAVPEYQDAKWPSGGQRISVSFNGHEGAVHLGVGLLTSDAIQVFNKVGALDRTQNKILAEIAKYFKVTQTSEVYDGTKDRFHQGFFFKTTLKTDL
jgi:hypothetical protein